MKCENDESLTLVLSSRPMLSLKSLKRRLSLTLRGRHGLDESMSSLAEHLSLDEQNGEVRGNGGWNILVRSSDFLKGNLYSQSRTIDFRDGTVSLSHLTASGIS